MSVEIDIFIAEDTVTAKLASLEGLMADPGVAMLSAGYEVYNFIKIYHEELNWKGDRYLSGPVSGRWQEEVVQDWQPPFQVDASTVSVINVNPTLSHKITGGTISAQSAGALTIPLIGEAKGIRAAEYEEFSGNKLFIPKGKSVLAYSEGEEIVPVYALKQSVYQEPWPGAMPPQEELQAVFDAAFAVDLETVLSA